MDWRIVKHAKHLDNGGLKNMTIISERQQRSKDNEYLPTYCMRREVMVGLMRLMRKHVKFDLTKVARDANMPVSTTHDRGRRVLEQYDLVVQFKRKDSVDSEIDSLLVEANRSDAV